MDNSNEDALYGSKYDRQLRLWNADGQHALAAARVLLVNVSAAAAETLKNLVLPGVSSIDVFDNSLVTDLDVAANFFLPHGTQGRSRAEVLAENLRPLNTDVTVTPLIDATLNSLQLQMYTVVIFASKVSTAAHLPYIAAETRRYEIPLVVVASQGFYAYLTLHLPQDRLILQTHSQIPPDLRINSPWPELAAHVNATSNFSNIPYAVLLAKLSRPGDTPSKLRNKLAELQKSHLDIDSVANFTEAQSKAHLALTDSSRLPENLRAVFEDHRANPPFEKSTPLQWILVAALHRFYSENNILPLTGELPDMEASTEAYMLLKTLHEEKAESDLRLLQSYVQDALASLGRSPDEASPALLRSFVRNCRRIKPQTAVPWTQPDAASTNSIYSAFAQLFSNSSSSPSHTLSPEYIELKRANGKELHSISAIIGGIAGQEVIKIITHQYIPIDNAVAFDGIHGKTIPFRTS